MVVRRKKKRKKLLGHRTHGHGDTKNNRGAGCRGGRGKAGSKKHKRLKYMHLFGTKVKLKTKSVTRGIAGIKAINLADLPILLEKLEAMKKMETENGLIVLDGAKIDVGKVLSRGQAPEKLLLRNLFVSKKALEKIENAQGKVELKEVIKAKKEKPAAKKEAKPEAPAEAPAKKPEAKPTEKPAATEKVPETQENQGPAEAKE